MALKPLDNWVSRRCRRSLSLGLLLALGFFASIFTPTLEWAGIPAQAQEKKSTKDKEKEVREKLEAQTHSVNTKLRALRAQKNAKIREARQVNSKIVAVERNLDQTRSKLRSQQWQLRNARMRLTTLTEDIDKAVGERTRLYQEARQRVRTLYMGGRVNMLQVLMGADDISTFLDRLYYKQRLVAHDKRVLEALSWKEKELRQQREALSRQKVYVEENFKNKQKLEFSLKDQIARNKLWKQKLLKDAKYYEQSEKELLKQSKKLESEIMKLTKKDRKAKIKISGVTGHYSWPVKGRISSGFGMRRHPIARRRRMHTGLDIAKGCGVPVKAADGGKVIQVKWRGGYGKVVVINHGSRGGKNHSTLYAHLSSQSVKTGQTVSQGQVVGRIGTTGNSTGCHLHFEVRLNGKPVNPQSYLR